MFIGHDVDCPVARVGSYSEYGAEGKNQANRYQFEAGE
jgi:hypothetical protein